jgi:hypothetical protein
MGTYNADFRVTYQSDLQSRRPVEQAARDKDAATKQAAASPTTTTLGAVYGGTILGQDANAERGNR